MSRLNGTKKTIDAQWFSFHLLCTYISFNRWIHCTDPKRQCHWIVAKNTLPTKYRQKRPKKKWENKTKEIVYIVNTFSLYHIIFIFSWFVRSFVSSSSFFLRFYRAYISIDTRNMRWKSTSDIPSYNDERRGAKKKEASSIRSSSNSYTFEIEFSLCYS